MTPILAGFSYGFFAPGLELGPPLLADALVGVGGARVVVPFEPPLDDASLRCGLPLVAQAVRQSADQTPLAILGECSVAPAVLAGAQRRIGTPAVACIWVDAHGDLNTPTTSASGFVGGMGLAAVCGRWADSWVASACGLEPIDPAIAYLVGARKLDAEESAYVADGQLGVSPSVRTAVALLPPDVPIYLHLDLDVMDRSVNPAIDLSVPGGWGVAEVRDGVAAVLETGRAAAISVVWGIPERDTPDGAGLRACVEGLSPLLA
jgi:arginase